MKQHFPSAVIVSILVVYVFLVFTLYMRPAYAVDYWDNAINLYPSTTTKWDGIQEIENLSPNVLEVRIDYYSSNNISVFKKYVLTGNETTFVTIEDGVVTKSSDFIRVGQLETLVLNVEAKPVDSVSEEQTCSVTVTITRTEITEGYEMIVPAILKASIMPISSYPTLLDFWSGQIQVTGQVKLQNLLHGNQTVSVDCVVLLGSEPVFSKNLTVVLTALQTAYVNVTFTVYDISKSYLFEALIQYEFGSQKLFREFKIFGGAIDSQLQALFIVFLGLVGMVALVWVRRATHRHVEEEHPLVEFR